jgi:hypothetical protein
MIWAWKIFFISMHQAGNVTGTLKFATVQVGGELRTRDPVDVYVSLY